MGQDGQWLLNSLVVVIIGGMGSLLGAAAGSILYGLVFAFSAVYLPDIGNNCCSNTRSCRRSSCSRSCSPSGRRDCSGERVTGRAEDRSPSARRDRGLDVAMAAPLLFNAYWVDVDPHAGADSRHRRGEPDLPRRLRRHGLTRAGRCLDRRLHDRQHGHEGWRGRGDQGAPLGWDPTLALVLAILGTTPRPALRCAVLAEHRHLLPHDHPHVFGVGNYFFGPVTSFGGFSAIGSVNQYTPPSSVTSSMTASASTTSRSSSQSSCTSLIRFVDADAFRPDAPGVRDEPVRMARSATPSISIGCSRSASRAFLASLAGMLFVWWQGQISPGDIGLPATIDLLVDRRDRGPDPHRGRVARRDRLAHDQQLRP